MGKKGGDAIAPEVKTPDPVAPASPTAKGSEEVRAAGKEEKERLKKAFSHSKTLLSRNYSEDTGNTGNTTLGWGKEWNITERF